MGVITIQQVTLHHVRVPLKRPFSTHLQLVQERESILLEMVDDQGHIGVGECVAFTTPWYTEETVNTAWQCLENWVIPSIINQTFSHPNDVDVCLSSIKRNHMAKSAVNQAFWDIYAKKRNQPLWEAIGGTSQAIPAGVVVASTNEQEMFEDIQSAVTQGYKRIKIKISRTSNPHSLKAMMSSYPQMMFFADANGAFTEETIPLLQAFDDCGFTLIEQPFSEQQNQLSATVQKTMNTPFALDESITSLQDAEEMINNQSGKVLVMKQGRVGGLSSALRIHEQCVNANIPIWVGGMIEFGVSKAFNLAFASLPGVKFPGDFSSSTHYWEQDLASPPIDVNQGVILLPSIAGVGVSLNYRMIKKYEVRNKQFYAKKPLK